MVVHEDRGNLSIVFLHLHLLMINVFAFVSRVEINLRLFPNQVPFHICSDDNKGCLGIYQRSECKTTRSV